MTTEQLNPRLQTIVDKVSALQRMKQEAGFQTKKTVRELLGRLSPDDLALVAEALYSK